jgi:RNA polymerase sigma factor (sigma-70 family)
MNDPCGPNQNPAEMETALTLIYDGWSPAFQTIANRWIRRYGISDRVAPDDLLGMAMLALLRKPMQIPRLEPPALEAYASVIMRNQAIMILRKKQAERRALRTKMERLRQAMVCVEEADPAATYRWNQCLEVIYQQLTGEERMLAMYRRAGYSWSEIAALMNSSPGRLKKRFERAIRRVKGLLEP